METKRKAFLTYIQEPRLKILVKIQFGHKGLWVPHPIPYHSSPIPMSMQSLKKIGKKVIKLEHGNKAQNISDIHQGP